MLVFSAAGAQFLSPAQRAGVKAKSALCALSGRDRRATIRSSDRIAALSGRTDLLAKDPARWAGLRDCRALAALEKSLSVQT